MIDALHGQRRDLTAEAPHKEHAEVQLRERVAALEAELRSLRATVATGTWAWDSAAPERATLSEELCDALAVGGADGDEAGQCTVDVETLVGLLDADERRRVDARVRRRIKRGGRFKTEVRCEIGGAPRWVSTAGEVVVGERGRRLLTGTASLVAGEAVEERNEQARRARAVRDAVREVGVYLWEYPASGDGALEIAGVDLEPLAEVDADADGGYEDPWRALVHPDDHDGLWASLAPVLRAPGAFSTEVRVRLPNVDGDADGFRHYVCRGLSEEVEGGGIRLSGTLFDIEERVRADRAAAAVRDRLQLVIRGAHCGVYDWPDTNAEPVTMDPSMIALLGYREDEVEQTASWWNGLIHPDDRAGVHEAFLTAAREGTDYNHVYRMRFRDRSYRTVHSLAAVRANGEHYALTGMILDVEDAHADQRRLRAAHAQLGRFSDLIAHDLGASFRHADAFAQIIAEDLGDGLADHHRAIIARLRQATKNGRRMIDDLHTYGRTGASELDIRAVALGSLLREVRETLSHDGNAAHVSWEIPALPSVRADETQMRMLFQNLLSNAIKFTRGTPGARVEIVSRVRDGAEAEIVVRDNGAGFDPSQRVQIFEAFSRAHLATEFEGTGMGLANVARIVARHGGRISAEGEPGRGATFTVVLPLA